MFGALALQLLLLAVLELSDADLQNWLLLLVTWPITAVASLIGLFVLLRPWWIRRVTGVERRPRGDERRSGHDG